MLSIHNSHVCSQILTSVAKTLDNHRLDDDVDVVAAADKPNNTGTANTLVSSSGSRKGFTNRHLTTLGLRLHA